MGTSQDITWLSASELADLIRARKLSPVEVVSTLLERIKSINPQINAYVTVTADLALAAAKEAEDVVRKGGRLGPLHGVPFAVKDVTFTKGVRTTFGSKLRADFVPDEDAVHVARLKAAGAILMGKTNVPEFAASAVTDNLIFGPTRNPWNLQRTTGGSSGGSAAAVAAGLAPIATGNDAGGSIRNPASCCGIFGIKPEFGRVPNYPLLHMFHSLMHEGALTRTVKDAAIMLDVMSGPHWGDRHSLPPPAVNYTKSVNAGVKGLRVAWSPDLGYATVAREVRDICLKAVRKFTDASGIPVEEANLNLGNIEDIGLTLVDVETAAMLTPYGSLADLEGKIHPVLLGRITPVQKKTAFEYLKAEFARNELSAKIGQFFEKYDLLFTHTMATPAWPIDQPHIKEVDGKPVSRLGAQLNFPFNLTGQPAASIPVGFTRDGLPVGMQIVSRHYDEAAIFRAAAFLEEINPWAQRRPPLA